MWDLTIHSTLEPSVLAGTRYFLQSMWDLTIQHPSGPSVLTKTQPDVHPLLGSASSLTHCSVSSSDTFCKTPSLPLADIVLFGLSLSSFSSRFLKRVCYGEVSTPFIKNVSFSSPTDVESHSNRVNFSFMSIDHKRGWIYGYMNI